MNGWWIAAAASAAIFVVALVADRARARRGYAGTRGKGLPWHLILAAALLATMIFLLLAVTGRVDLPTGYPLPRARG